MAKSDAMNSSFEKIRATIQGFPKGKIFFLNEFNSLGSSDAIRSAMVRLCDEKIIVRIGKGIYFYPEIDTEFGLGVLYPSVDKIAKAISQREHCRIAPTGAFALNTLGLSTQIQTNVVYYTDGSARRLQIGNGRGILFKRSTEMKRFAYKSELMQLIVTALREIGNTQLTPAQKEILAKHLKNVGEEDYTHDITLAPAWVQEVLKEIR